MAVTPAPNYSENHTVVALGEGPTCHCLVLFQSVDGAATWQAAPGPPTGAQVALPADYPRDPRIFIGNPATLGRSSDWVADEFGATFRPLPTPSGFLALSGAFDLGDPRVYVATATGVLTLDFSTGVPSVGTVSSQVWGVPSVASRPHTAGVFALVPPGSLNVPGDGQTELPNSAGSALLGCSVGICSRMSDTGSAAANVLAVSATYDSDEELVAWGGQVLVLSRDGGRSFERVAAPAGTAAVRSVALGGRRLWLETQDNSAAIHVYWSAVGERAWHEVAVPTLQPRPSAPRLVALDAERLLYLVDGTGFRCTVDSGATWHTSCPPA